MNGKKHKTPSRDRYEKKYPVWSVRMPQEWINEVELILKDTGQSRRDFMGIALRKQKADYTQAWEKGNDEGKTFGIKIGKKHGYKKAMAELPVIKNS